MFEEPNNFFNSVMSLLVDLYSSSPCSRGSPQLSFLFLAVFSTLLSILEIGVSVNFAEIYFFIVVGKVSKKEIKSFVDTPFLLFKYGFKSSTISSTNFLLISIGSLILSLPVISFV